MDRLTDVPELLDGPLDDPAALVGNLRDLRRINRWLGGVTLTSRAIDALAAHRGDLSVLDVGTGGADIPLALLADAPRRGRTLHVVGLDSRPEVLAAAALAAPAVIATDGLTMQLGDGRSLPYADDAFDVVHASLVLHHLDGDDGPALLREMARVARLGIVVNDLHRGRLAWVGRVAARPPADAATGTPATTRRCRSGARTGSTRRSTLVRATGLAPVRTIRGRFGHRYAIAAVRPTEVGLLGAGDLDRA